MPHLNDRGCHDFHGNSLAWSRPGQGRTRSCYCVIRADYMKHWDLLKGHLLGSQMKTMTRQWTFHWVWWCPKWERQESSLMFRVSWRWPVTLSVTAILAHGLLGIPLSSGGSLSEKLGLLLFLQNCDRKKSQTTSHCTLQDFLQSLKGKTSQVYHPHLHFCETGALEYNAQCPHDSGDTIDLPQMHSMFSGAREPNHHDSGWTDQSRQVHFTCFRKGQSSILKPHLSSAVVFFHSQDSLLHRNPSFRCDETMGRKHWHEFIFLWLKKHNKTRETAKKTLMFLWHISSQRTPGSWDPLLLVFNGDKRCSKAWLAGGYCG